MSVDWKTPDSEKDFYQFKSIGEQLWIRFKGDRFWSLESGDVIPGIRCECGGDVFRLNDMRRQLSQDGSYELVAHCVQCGLTEEVYSG